MELIEYRVRPVVRYEITRYEGTENTGCSSFKGEYGNNEIAFEVAYALCRAEHERLGWPAFDGRIKYPERVDGAVVVEQGGKPERASG